jgi:glycerol-3-phosphate dehydrogenase
VNAAGLHSDDVNRSAGRGGFTITPRRGELIVFDKLARPLVSHILLPVPTGTTKGVLIAPTVFGNVMLGPTADYIYDKTDTASTAAGVGRLTELGGALMPALLEHEVTAVYAGLRAATEHSDYQLEVDAELRYACAGGIRSTGLTGALGIAGHVHALYRDAGNHHAPVAEPHWPRVPNLAEHGLRDCATPGYGEIICHCEGVTRREIEQALQGPLKAQDLGGLKRRTRAMMGRCQGFYCSAAVSAIADQHLTAKLAVENGY